MKNTRLKNVIFTAGMAIFTGVLLLGVNAAIGAATPTINPPGVGVFPTFTGLDVIGNIQNTAGNVSVDDNLAVTGNVIATGSVSATNNLSASGDVSAGGSANIAGNADVGGNAGINGDVIISGDADVSGTVSADSITTTIISDDSGNAVLIDDGLIVDGPGASRIDGSFINVNAVLRANNGIINMANGGAAPVTINDNMVVTGTSDLQSNVSDSNSAFTIADDLTLIGLMDIAGVIKNTATVNSPLALGIPQPVIVDDNLSVIGSIIASGNVLAERFGTVTVRATDKISYNNSTSIDQTIACNAGEELLSCGASTFTNLGGYDYSSGFQLKAIQFWDDDTCRGRARNESGTTKQFRVYAMCWDPAL